MKIICHPDNYKWLQEALSKHSEEVGQVSKLVPPWARMRGVQIMQDTHVPVFRETGKYLLCDGQIQGKDEIHYVERFCTYGPEDLDFLLYARLAKPYVERVFYKMEESNFDPMLLYSPFGSVAFFNPHF